MPAWATVLLSFGGGVIGIAGTLLGGQLQHKHAIDERRAAEKTRLRERGAAILGPIGTLLSDADPTRVGINAGPQSKTALSELWARWLTLRDELASYGAGHPVAELASSVQRLVVAVSNTITSAGFLVDDLLGPAGAGHNMLAIARNDHELAQRLLEVMQLAIRGSMTGEELAAKVAKLEKGPRPSGRTLPETASS